MWKVNQNGKYTIKSAYENVSRNDSILVDTSWNLVWKSQFPPRIKYFLRIVKKGRLLTNSERVRRKLIDNAGCPLCSVINETIVHVLRDCYFAAVVWRQVIQSDSVSSFFELNVANWLLSMLRGRTYLCSYDLESVVLFLVLC